MPFFPHAQTGNNEDQTFKSMKRPSYQFEFSRLMLIYWMFMSTSSFIAVYLQSKGLSSVDIGKVTAANAFLGIFAPPIWGIIADKLRSSKKAYLACLLLTAVFMALMPIAGTAKVSGVLMMTVLVPVIHFFRSPSDSIINSWIIQTAQREKGMDFGAIRLWGSVGSALMAVVFYYLIRLFSTDILFTFPLLLVVPTLYYAVRLPDSHVRVKDAKKEKLKPWRLLKNYYLMAFLLLCLMFSISSTAIFIFRAYLILDVGGDPSALGLIIGLKVFFEVPTMIFSRRLLNRLRPTVVLLIISAIFLSEHFLYTICTSTFQILLIQMYQGLGNGLNTPTMVDYIFKLAPDGLKSTAQSMCAMVVSTGAIIGSLFGGWAVGALGVRMLFRLTSLNILLAAALFVLSFVIGQKILKIEPPVPLLEKRTAKSAV